MADNHRTHLLHRSRRALQARRQRQAVVRRRRRRCGQYYTILASAAITGTGTTVLRVYPGLTAASNLVANDILPSTWRVNLVHADSDSITYSVAAQVVI